ncbi:MAG: helix-turn-helix domain-containing protein [Clostridiales bacterium]|nr:helix-turn-helix domain-containing protein [Clostridiales bacterium]
MNISKNIRLYREERKLTQEQVADAVGVSFQAVSSWERGEYSPDIDKLIKLAELFDISLSALVEEREGIFTVKDSIYNWEHMKTFIKTTCKNLGLTDSLKAVEYATCAHEGQKRKKSEVPYIYHPLTLACHALAMGITEDDIIAACLLHDVVEDCGKTLDELPVSDDTRKLVGLLTHSKTTPSNRDSVMRAYFDAIATDPKACLIKCIDRCDNMTTIARGLSRERIYRTIRETEEYFPRLIAVIKDYLPYNNAAWLLRYQMDSMLDIYKRLM